MNVLRVTSRVLFALIFMGLSACSGGGGEPSATTPGPSASLVANAGPDQSVSVGSFVTLNGVNSINSRGTGLTYAWTLKPPPGSQAALSNSSIVNPTFTVDVGGIYEATLVVSDGSLASASDMVLVLANGTPAANPGLDMNAFVNRPVVLDGSGSKDTDGDPLKFQWSITSKPSRSISQLYDANTVAPTFTPDLPGDYSVQLIVNDSKTSSPPAKVSITASTKPPPTVDVGVPAPFQKFVRLNTETISLNGSASHTNPPGEPLAHLWTIQPQGNAPPVTLNLTTPSTATFSPKMDTAGTYVATLVVTEPNHPDSAKNTATQSVTITIGPLARLDIYKESVSAVNLLSSCTLSPCAPVSVQSGTIVQFDGSGSSVQPLTYQWTSPSNLNGGTTATPSFTPGSPGQYTVSLTVTDGGTNTDTKSVTLNAVEGPSIGIVRVTQDGQSVQSVRPSTTALLITTASGTTNPDCEWTFDPQNQNVTITPVTCTAGDGGITANIRATVSGTYMPKLTVSDRNNPGFTPAEIPVTFIANQSPTVTLSVPTSIPNTEAPNTTKTACLSVRLTATATSSDNYPNQGYSWDWSGISGSSFTEPAINKSEASFTVKDTGGYTVTATATEVGAPANLASNSATRTLSFTNEAAGHTLYHTGITDVTTGACMACHQAGTHDTTVKDSFASALSTKTLVGQSATAILTKLNSAGHFGRLFNTDGTARSSPPTGSANQTQADNLAAFLATVECLNQDSGH